MDRMVLAFLLSGVASATTNDTRQITSPVDYEEKLMDVLFDGYRKSIRPGLRRDGKKDPVQVSTTFIIYRLLASDDRLETISAIVLVRLAWFDQRLGWNPIEYGNVTDISLDWGTIWAPKLTMPNFESLNPDDTSSKSMIAVKQIPDEATGGFVGGYLSSVAYNLVQERCAFDMTYFPFDNQQCRICGGSTDGLGEVHYISTDPSRQAFEPGGEWDLVDVANDSEPGHSACFAFTIQRRSVYYVINLFLPTIIICILNTIGLFASIHTGSEEMEFSSLGQTTLLSLGVLMLTVADQTPKGASQISLLGIFFLAMICQTLLAALTAIILKQEIRKLESELSSHHSTTAIKFDIYHFLKSHGTKICLVSHLVLITFITALVLGLGYSNVRPTMKIEG